ncbi:restriction endonuclease subunit S, partial [Rhizobium pisi]
MITAVPFTDLLAKIVDNRGKTCPTTNAGLPLIATNCVKNTTLYPVFEKVRYVSEEVRQTWFRGHPLAGDLIFVTKGSPGQVCLVPSPVGFCIAQDMVAVRADSQKVYPPYLFAALRSEAVQRDIANMHVGSLIPHFKKGDFDKLRIPLPERRQQVFIGDYYLELSQKIELDRRNNETLEAMAQAIFRDWFVDFGPTRRKIEGASDPAEIMGGLVIGADQAQQLADLFPAGLGDNGLPEGWMAGALGD